MSKTDKNLILEVTPAEYEEALAKGWNDDDIQKPGKHKYRRTTRIAKPSESKVKITMWLDGDILMHFQKRAADSNAAPYQTQINAELRKIMEKDLSDETSEMSKNIENLTTNKEFIRAVAEQLKELKAA